MPTSKPPWPRRAKRPGRSLAASFSSLTIEQPVPLQRPSAIPLQLSAHQQEALGAVRAALEARAFQAFLLYGVTGSGKTEVYLGAIETALALGRSALLLVPEIALTPQVAAQFYFRFGDRAAILHSAFHDAERSDQWKRIRSGTASVVVGTRSAVFAPVQDVGLIIVDEEHDHSYKQQETPRYNGRDVAVVRAQAAGAVVIMGSATPSLESRYNVERGKYTHAHPSGPHRAAADARGGADRHASRVPRDPEARTTFSRRLLDEVTRRLESREQVMLLHNRRGFSSFVACRACGERVTCVNCAVTLTYHRRDRRMLCHYCSYAEQDPHRLPEVRQRVRPIPRQRVGARRG